MPQGRVARAQVHLELGDGEPAEAEHWLLEGLEAAGAADNLQMELVISTHLERLACEHLEHAERFLARAMRLRKRLHEARGS